MATINDARVREILLTSPTVAVLGIHTEPDKAAFYVPEYLYDEGYRVIGVNPRFAGTTLFGETVLSRLRDIDVPIDLVDIFRRSDAIGDHLDDILAMRHRPRVVWMQLGIRNDDVAAKLEAEGIVVVQNRCTLADHQRLGLGKPERQVAKLA